ncbi:MAG: aldehyde dehydrogenase family protein [Vicinamibacterales bacterium]
MESGELPAEYADEVLGRAVAAAAAFRECSQAQADAIVRAVFEAAYDARVTLARQAFEETGVGVFEDKVIKNAWASVLVYEDICRSKTVGVVAEDEARGITEIAQPKGPILATVPLTNPTATTIFKALICLKTRNPLIVSPHRAARRCVKETVRILASAAQRAGAPAHAIQFMGHGRKEHLSAVMCHPDLALILATGTTSLVELAQKSGTPTLGVGPGNVPVYVDGSADLEQAAQWIVHSKTFDNGTICASEQALVAEQTVAEALQPLLEARGAWFCSPDETAALGPVCFDVAGGRMRPEAVGQPARVLAGRAGFRVPDATRLLVAECTGVGREHPLSHEILMPVLTLYRCGSYDEAFQTCRAITMRGGVGHTVVVYANDDRVVEDFARLDAARILVNQPSTQGAIGGIFNTLRASLSLACGTGAGNMTTDNISVDHLLNIHRVARPRFNADWARVRQMTLDESVDARAILERYHRPA